MFRVEFFVDDKHLAEVMHAVAGRSRNLNVQPVANSGNGPGGEVKAFKAGSVHELLLAAINQSHPHRVTAGQARVLVQKLGFAPDSTSYYLKRLVDSGAMQRHGHSNASYYTPMHGPMPAPPPRAKPKAKSKTAHKSVE
jgi:hypothetical protein